MTSAPSLKLANVGRWTSARNPNSYRGKPIRFLSLAISLPNKASGEVSDSRVPMPAMADALAVRIGDMLHFRRVAAGVG